MRPPFMISFSGQARIVSKSFILSHFLDIAATFWYYNSGFSHSGKESTMLRFKIRTIAVCFIILISAILILAALSSNFGSNIDFTLSEDPAVCYSASTEKLSEQYNMQLIVDTYELLETNENQFKTARQQNVTCLNRNADDLQLYATESISTGTLDLQTCVVYCDKTLYYTLNDSKFAGNYESAAVSAQYPPPVILDPNNYQAIDGLQVGNSTVIFFSAPKQQEMWTGIADAAFTDAYGYAWIDHNGDLIKSTYNLCYTIGDYTFYRSVTVRIADLDPAPITLPTNADEFVRLSDPLLPMQLELACGYLLQAQNLKASHTDTITCELFGDTRDRGIDILIEKKAEDQSLEMATSIKITNNSREGAVFTSKQVQRYENGNYTLITNDTPDAAIGSISSWEFLANCQEMLIGTILLPQHIQDAEISYAADLYRVEFTANEEFAQKIISDACTTLYNEPQLLNELAAEQRVDKVLCYLELDAQSGLPVKSGIHFLGTYYSGGLPYQLIFESDQTYVIP